VQQYWKGVGRYGTVGLELALSILVGLLLGQWLDKKLHTHGVLTLIGLGYGLAAAVRVVWRALKQANREAEDEERREREARKKFNDDDRAK
jgi:F0F1-type ATP synthase assembly protein I